MVRFFLALVLTSATAHAQSAPGVLPRGIFVTTITAEIEASKDTFGDPVSIAPDLSIGVTDELTLMALHSTFGRTGFRGNAGSGICITDACRQTYDNVGAEAAYNLVDGPVSLAANAGFHAVSLDLGHYAAKAGARLRVMAGPLSITSLPSVLIAVTKRDDLVKNRDRVFVPINVSTSIAPGLTLGLITGFKSPLDEIGKGYELAAGAFASYAVTDSVAFSASWVHGKIAGGDEAIPEGTSGVDSRAIQLWVTITRSAYPRYK
jgi:hypothetical protein